MVVWHVLRDHAFIGLIAGFILSRFWSVSDCLIFWFSTVLMDFDHYLNLLYWSNFRVRSIFKTIDFYSHIFENKRGHAFLALELFHTVEFMAALCFLAFFVHPGVMKPVFYGFAFHVVVDFFHLYRLKSLRIRNHSVIEYLVRRRAMEKNGFFPDLLHQEAAAALILV